MSLKIRQEQLEDYEITESVIKAAFVNAKHSDKKEHELVNRIKRSNEFIPRLSLVAADPNTNKILGHILLSKIKIRKDN